MRDIAYAADGHDCRDRQGEVDPDVVALLESVDSVVDAPFSSW
jgi:hypothetical protein